MILPRSRRATALAVAFGVASVLVAPVFDAGAASAGSVKVGTGETLSSIASRYHTTVAALAAANGITNPNLVYAGAVLRLPSSSAVSSGTFRVAPGETLTEIARAHGVSVAALAAANAITNPNLVYAGQLLELPAPSVSAPEPSNSQVNEVTVQQGDTLISLAARYRTTVGAIAQANGITNFNRIYVGMHLSIPGSAMVLASYSVQLPAASSSLPPQLLAHPSRLPLRADFVSEAADYAVPASLLEALCWWESGWQVQVVSSTGAIGVCQIEPSTASFVNTVLYPGRNLDVHTASGNIAIGAAYLHSLLQRTHGNQGLAVAGYYQGLSSVQQRGMLPTTRNYVTGILAYSAIFASAW